MALLRTFVGLVNSNSFQSDTRSNSMHRSQLASTLSIALLTFSLGSAFSPSRAEAAVFMNMNFDSQNVGDPINTTWPSAPSPETNAYATGGFPVSGPYTGSDTVVDLPGLSKAVLMSTDQAGTGANYMDTQFLVAGNQISLNFDIRMVSQAAGGYDQAVGPNTVNGQSFAINAFALDCTCIFRFIATPTSTTTGVFGMRNNTDGDLIPFGAYTVGTDYHVSIVADYVTNTVNASVSGVGTLTNLPFTSPEPVTGGMEEFFFFQNGLDGSSNQVALDNIVGATIPEPASAIIWSLVAVIGLGVGWWKRRRTA